jgi:hypothetical protein
VVAKIGFESFDFARIDMVSAEFIDARLREGASGQQGKQQKTFFEHEIV